MTLCCSSAKFFGEDEKFITLKEVLHRFCIGKANKHACLESPKV